MAKLDYNAARHEYRLDGLTVPSVTQVLGELVDFSVIPRVVFEAACIFGQHVHKATELDDLGVLDEASLDAPLAPYLEGWRRFRKESEFVPLAVEEAVYHPGLRYAGTLDRRGYVRGRMTIVDIKSGDLPRTVGPQTAAYEHAYKAMANTTERFARLCVQLSPDFAHGYKTHPLDNLTDFAIFQSALNCYRFKYPKE